MANTAVTEAKTTSLVPDGLMDIFEENAGAGLQNIGADQMQIPFIRILQALSPQLNKDKPEYIKGASQGDIFNTVTGEIYPEDTGITVIPVAFEMKYLEFVPRSQGGGLVGEIPASSPDLDNTQRDGPSEVLPSGNELVRCHQNLVMVYNPETEGCSPAVLDMKKTQIKVSKKWNAQRTNIEVMGKNGSFTLPIYGTAWNITTVSESNDQGTWYNFRIARETEVSNSLAACMMKAKEMADSFQKGEIKTAAGTSDEMQQAKKTDDIPF